MSDGTNLKIAIPFDEAVRLLLREVRMEQVMRTAGCFVRVTRPALALVSGESVWHEPVPGSDRE